MKCVGCKSFWIGLAFGLQCLMSYGAAEVTSTGAPMPPARSPIDLFRELLAMNPAQRRDFLTNRPPDSQKRILAKVQEYQALNPDERELRLRVTELHYYLMQILGTAATNRPAQLALMPPETCKLVEARLEEWDNLPQDLQQRLLENEATIRYFIDRAVHLPPQPGKPVQQIALTDQAKIEDGIRRWQQLTPEQRKNTLDSFRQVFELHPQEKQDVLAKLSEPERQQIEKTLQTFGNLTPKQRAQCIRSFEKFTNLSPDERRQFLENASLWEAMTPTERQTWRDLVQNLSRQPPLPPGLGGPPQPPPRQLPQRQATLLSNTN